MRCYEKFGKRISYHSILGDIKDLDDWSAHFLNTFIELAVNRFRWKNLPDEIDPRYLELSLLTAGSVVFFYDIVKGFCALEGAWSGVDMYYNPTDYHVVTPTGFSPNITMDEGVIIWNNFTRTSDMPSIWLYADSIAELYQTCLINCKGQKHPIVVLVDSEKERLTLENAYAKLDGNHPVIYLKEKGKYQEKFTTINAQVPFVAREILIMARSMMEEFFKWLGIRVPNVVKQSYTNDREQVNTNAITWQLRNRGLHARQVAAEQINRKFKGMLPYGDLEIEFNEEVIEMASELLDGFSEGVGGIPNE